MSSVAAWPTFPAAGYCRQVGLAYLKMLTDRARTRAKVTREIID